MTWKFVGDKKGLEPLTGLPVEASDKDFTARREAYDAFNGAGAFEAAKKLYEHIPEGKAAPAAQED